jgi:hypothetical protein
MRGLGAAGAAFGRSYGQALQLDKAEKRAINRQQFDLADSIRKEKMGILNDSIKAADQLSPAKREEYKSQLEKFKALANIGSAGARAMGKAGGAGGDKTKLNEQLAAAEVAYETNPTDATLKTVTALRRAVDRTKISDVGPVKTGLTQENQNIEREKLAAITDKEIDAQVNKSKFFNKDWQEAMGDPVKQANIEANMRKDIVNRRTQAKGQTDGGTSKVIKLD